MERLRDRNLTVNPAKCIFRAPKIMFFGFVISNDGIAADGVRIAAIRDARRPTNQSEVRSFLGLVNYCARLIPNLATIAEPLRRLTRGNQPWTWGHEQQLAFDRLRHVLTSNDVMAHFVTGAHTELRVDASPVGLGAVLTQTIDGISRPVAYASRTLSDVERRYSQTEREALAVVWGCEKYHIYLCGAEFVLHTDHKPLQFIYGPHGRPHARIERWALRLQQYRFRIQHMPGKTNPADVLSRLPIPGQAGGERSIAEEHISEILTSAIPRAMSKQDIALATKDDGELQKVIKNVQTNKWEKSDAFYKIRLELAVKDNVLLRGNRIVIPKTLRKRTLDIAHEAHQGIVRLKQALRTKVWWPNIDHEAEVLVRSCRPCQSEAPPPPSEPLHPSPMPPSPWHTVHMDLCGPLPTGETLLVVIDSATRWPEVEIIRSTTTRTIVSRLRRIFACHGYPTRVVTDNGPQFVSQEFKDFLRDAGIDHRRVTPYHPEANAAVERFNATLVSAIRKAREDGKDWKDALPTFLLTYRTTPHPATKSTPSRLMFNRDLRTKMPNIREPRVTIEFKKAAEEDDKYKDKMKTRAKSGNKSKSDINVGDHVVIRQPHINKFSTRYDTNPWIVIAKKGGSVKIQRGKYITMRYSSQMRKIPTPHYTRHKNAHDNDDELEFDNTPRENRDRDIGPNLHDREQSRCSQRQSRPPERLTYYRSGVIM